MYTIILHPVVLREIFVQDKSSAGVELEGFATELALH